MNTNEENSEESAASICWLGGSLIHAWNEVIKRNQRGRVGVCCEPNICHSAVAAAEPRGTVGPATYHPAAAAAASRLPSCLSFVSIRLLISLPLF